MSLVTKSRWLLTRVALLSGLLALFLAILHNAAVRRWALIQVHDAIARRAGIDLTAGSLIYDLLPLRFELRDVSIRSVRLPHLNGAPQATRISVRVPVWRVLAGSF